MINAGALTQAALDAAAQAVVRELPQMAKLALNAANGAEVDVQGTCMVRLPALLGGKRHAVDFRGVFAWTEGRPDLKTLSVENPREVSDEPGRPD